MIFYIWVLRNLHVYKSRSLVLFYSYSWFAMLGIAPFSYCSWGSLMAPLILVFSLFKTTIVSNLRIYFKIYLEIIFYLPVSMGNCDPFLYCISNLSPTWSYLTQCTCSNYSCITNINEKDSNIYFYHTPPSTPSCSIFHTWRLSCFTVIFCNPQKPKCRYCTKTRWVTLKDEIGQV